MYCNSFKVRMRTRDQSDVSNLLDGRKGSHFDFKPDVRSFVGAQQGSNETESDPAPGGYPYRST